MQTHTHALTLTRRCFQVDNVVSGNFIVWDDITDSHLQHKNSRSQYPRRIKLLLNARVLLFVPNSSCGSKRLFHLSKGITVFSGRTKSQRGVGELTFTWLIKCASDRQIIWPPARNE